MRVRLTDISIRNLKIPPKGQVTYWDTQFKGFGIRCSKAGAKSYVLKSQQQLTTIGRVTVISLAEARAKAKRSLAKRTLGLLERPSMPVEDAEELFFAACESRLRPRTLSDYRRLLGKHLKKYARRPVGGLTPQEVSQTIDSLKETPSEQNHAFAAARTFFRFCARRELIPRSPLDGIPLPARISARDRALADKEIKAVLKAAKQVGYPFGTIVELLIHTGQRKGEISQLEWTWIDQAKQTITVPAEVAKNHRQHTFPYGARVVDILAHVPKSEGALFRVHNWDKRTDNLRDKAAIPHFTLHDLRRT